MEHECKQQQTLEKISKTLDKIWEEIGGPPGQPGLKAKVEKQGAQIKGVAGVVTTIGAAFLALMTKLFFFSQ